jgi:hypothetical protein
MRVVGELFSQPDAAAVRAPVGGVMKSAVSAGASLEDRRSGQGHDRAGDGQG